MRKNILFLLLTILSIFMYAQNRAVKPSSGSSENTNLGRQALMTTKNALQTDLHAIFHDDRIKVFHDFLLFIQKLEEDTIHGYSEGIDVLEDFLEIAKTAPGVRVNTDEEIDLEVMKGVYEWNVQKHYFVKKSDYTKLVIRYPEEDGGKSNLKMILDEYKRDYEGNPQVMKFQFTRNGKDYLNFHFESIFDSDDIPVNLEINIAMSPYAIHGEMTRKLRKIDAKAHIKKNEKLIIESDAIIDFEDVDYEHLIAISGNAHLYELSLKANIDVDALHNMEHSEEEHYKEIKIVNNAIYAPVFYKNSNEKIGRVTFGDDERTPALYLKYTDNSFSDLEILVEEVVEGLEESHFIHVVDE